MAREDSPFQIPLKGMIAEVSGLFLADILFLTIKSIAVTFNSV